MKTIILIFAGIFTAGITFSQSLSLSDTLGNPYVDGQTVYFVNDISEDQILSHVNVTNNSGTALSVKVSRTEDDVLPGVSDDFCWAGACFPPGTQTSPLAAIIDPGTTNTEFEGHYHHNDIYGESIYTYTWFDENNTSDMVSLVIIYKLTAVGITENILKMISISSAYPNPANTYANFDYSMPSTIENATLIVTNLLGAAVKELSVSGSNGKIKLNTSTLEKGLYFGTLKVGNQIVKTQRFVVNH